MRRTSLSVLLLIAALAAALVGCSRMPTAPTAAARSGAGSSIIKIDDVPPPIVPGADNVITLGVGDEGQVSSGRFRLVVHKNSLKMQATIRVLQPDPNVMQVMFEITPPEANDFQVPVQLEADCSNEPLDLVKNETFYWWDGGWNIADAVSLDHASRTITVHDHSLRNGMVDAVPGAELVQH